jgi:hypothetical protein
MKGRAACARVERMRPERMRNSRSSAMARPRNVQNVLERQGHELAAHIALKARNVRSAPKT